MAIEAVYLPNNVMSDAAGTIIDRTIVQDSDTGFNARLPVESFPRRQWKIGWNRAEVPQIEQMFEALGRHTGFLIYAPRDQDHLATDELIGTGNGTTLAFQSTITRTFGSTSAVKNILHLKSGTVIVKVDGVTKAETTDYTVNYSTGVITFLVAPADTKPVTATFEYDTAAYFDSAELETTITRVGAAPVQEIRSAIIVEALNE